MAVWEEDFEGQTFEAQGEVAESTPTIHDEMRAAIEKMDAYAKARGTKGGFTSGFPRLDEALEGINTGLILIGGQSNIGKSAFCVQLAWQIALNNRTTTEDHPNKAYVLYFSLDDNTNDLLPRIIAIDKQIPINVVRSPRKYAYEKAFLNKRTEGLQRLIDAVPYFKMLDSMIGTDVEIIEEQIRRHSEELKQLDPAYKLVVFIDNFHDISTQMKYKDQNERYDHIAGELTRMATEYDIPVICTAEFRKLNGNRRPTTDDVRESVKIMYEAKAAMLCYNEVGLRQENANVFREDGEGHKAPVFEVHIGKNKFGSFKGRLFYEFFPEMSLMREADESTSQNYIAMM